MPPKPSPEKSTWRQTWLLKCTLLLLFVALFLGAVIWAGRWGLEQLRGSDRYRADFSDIECDPPVGMKKQDFLDEVRFEAHLPRQFSILEAELPVMLRTGFAKHHWVEKVDSVEINSAKHIVVKLTHRRPVLAVRVGDELRAVDGNGVLLYTNAPTAGLPVYEGNARPPQGRAGTRWGDPNVEAAARKLKK